MDRCPLCIPEKITESIFDTEPDQVSAHCQDSIGTHYDAYFPEAARSAVSTLLLDGKEIPGGDEVCHMICDEACDTFSFLFGGSQWMDPTEYFLAAEVRKRDRMNCTELLRVFKFECDLTHLPILSSSTSALGRL